MTSAPGPGPGPAADEQEIRSLNRKTLLEWLKQKLSLEPEDEKKFSETFSEAGIDAQVFLKGAGDDELFQRAGFTFGVSIRLADLASEVIGEDTVGTKSKSYLSCHPCHAEGTPANSVQPTKRGKVKISSM